MKTVVSFSSIVPVFQAMDTYKGDGTHYVYSIFSKQIHKRKRLLL